MTAVAAEQAVRMLARRRGEGVTIQVTMSRKVGTSATATLDRVLPESQKVLLTIRDENGQDVAATMSLEGAQWEHGGEGAILTATFPNGNRYVFSKQIEPSAG